MTWRLWPGPIRDGTDGSVTYPSLYNKPPTAAQPEPPNKLSAPLSANRALQRASLLEGYHRLEVGELKQSCMKTKAVKTSKKKVNLSFLYLALFTLSNVEEFLERCENAWEVYPCSKRTRRECKTRRRVFTSAIKHRIYRKSLLCSGLQSLHPAGGGSY